MRFEIGMCPDPIIDDSMSRTDRGQAVRVNKGDTGYDVIVFMCPEGHTCYEGIDIRIGMCPNGETCGCEYDEQSPK